MALTQSADGSKLLLLLPDSHPVFNLLVNRSRDDCSVRQFLDTVIRAPACPPLIDRSRIDVELRGSTGKLLLESRRPCGGGK